jgi:hypothetical protein
LSKRNLSKVITYFFISVFPYFSVAQNVITISGRVENDAGASLPYANVMIHHTSDSMVSLFTHTDQKGNFSIIYSGKLPVLISASALGFAKYFTTLDSTNNTSNVIFTLHNEAKILDEVIVTSIPKIQVKNDTTSYKLSAFLTGNERTLEEALSKLPGFKIGDDGRIAINGRSIQKILLEGDDLIGNNYTALSKSLKPDIVNQVQVLDKFLNDKMMKGIEKTDDVAVNLLFKDEFKNVIVADILAEGGPGGYYNALANGILISKKTKAYATVKTNNIGKHASFISNNTTNPQTSLAIAYTPMLESKELVNISPGNIPMIENWCGTIDNTKAGSLNYLKKVSQKMNIKMNLSFLADKNVQEKNSLTQFFLIHDTITNNEKNRWTVNAIQPEGSIDAEYYFSNKSRMKYMAYGISTHNSEMSNFILNSDSLNQSISTKGYTLNQQLNFTLRPTEKSALIVDLIQFTNRKSQQFNVSGYSYDSIFESISQRSLYQSSSNPINYLGGQAKYYTSFREATIILTTGYDRYQQEINSAILPSKQKFANELESIKNIFFTRIDYNKRVTKFFEVTARLGMYNMNLRNNWHNSIVQKNKNNSFLSPDIMARFFLKDKSRITLNYKYSREFPNAEKLYDSLIFSDYRNADRYSYNNQIWAQSKFSIGYRYNDSYKQFLAFFNIFQINNYNSYSDSTTINKQFWITNKISLPQRTKTLALAAGVDKFISHLSGTLRFSFNAIENTYKNSINSNQEREVSSWSISARLAFISSLNGFFNFSTHFAYNNNLNFIKIQNLTSNNSTYNIKGYLQTDYQIFKQYYLQVLLNRYQWFANSQKQRPIYMLDVSFVGYPVTNKLTISATLQNALNAQRVNFYTQSDYKSVLNSYSILQRTLVFGIKYQL